MSILSPERWKELSAYLDQALTLQESERAGWLDSVRADDPELAAELQQLLEQHEAATRDGFLANRPAQPATIGGLAGQEVGAYRLIGVVGRGGMGAVWLAERSDGRFQRKAAVKFLNLGMAGQSAEERFAREGAILGRLAHPNIAELLDAGVTASGQPFIILEYVEGDPIDRYCDAHTLDLKARITLFLDVLGAVAHAHANLIVHRDLKPSNVFVSKEGQVKLLDFGIAKLLEGEGQQTVTLLTRAGDSPLTPEYAAPEQITGKPITTATDVYALGILLYQLLTGRHPAESALRSPAALVKAIVDTEPARPSTSVEQAGQDPETNTANAANRDSTPDKLSRLLRGDLDTIVGKALKKLPQERYGSPTALADDLRRYLKHEPISARPDSVLYRAGKFVRRNWSGVALTTVALAAVLAGAAVAIYQARIARHRFDDLRRLAHTFVFDVHDEVAKLQGSTKAREMIVATALQYLDNLSKDAKGDLALQKEIADAYEKVAEAQGLPTRPNLGRVNDAMVSYRKAGDLYTRLAARDKSYLPDLATYDSHYSSFLRTIGQRAQAKDYSRAAIDTFDRIRTYRPLDPAMEQSYIMAWCTLGDIDEDLSAHYRESLQEYSRCAALAQERAKREPNDIQAKMTVVQAEERMGSSEQAQGLLPEALAALDAEESALRDVLKAEPQNPRYKTVSALLPRFRSRIYLDDIFPALGDPVHGLQWGKVYQEEEQQLVEKDPNDATAKYRLASADYNLAYDLGPSDPEAAVREARDSLRLFDELIASGKNDILNLSGHAKSRYRLAEALLQAGRTPEAHSTAELVLTDARRNATDPAHDYYDDLNLVRALVLTGRANEVAGDAARAESLLREARDRAAPIAKTPEPPRLISLSRADEALGGFYAHRHRKAEARACYQEMVALWQGYPESNAYLERQIAASKALLAGVQ
jgi:eukaryotic-like serine/threonine-protein kinase